MSYYEDRTGRYLVAVLACLASIAVLYVMGNALYQLFSQEDQSGTINFKIPSVVIKRYGGISYRHQHGGKAEMLQTTFYVESGNLSKITECMGDAGYEVVPTSNVDKEHCFDIKGDGPFDSLKIDGLRVRIKPNTEAPSLQSGGQLEDLARSIIRKHST